MEFRDLMPALPGEFGPLTLPFPRIFYNKISTPAEKPNTPVEYQSTPEKDKTISYKWSDIAKVVSGSGYTGFDTGKMTGINFRIQINKEIIVKYHKYVKYHDDLGEEYEWELDRVAGLDDEITSQQLSSYKMDKFEITIIQIYHKVSRYSKKWSKISSIIKGEEPKGYDTYKIMCNKAFHIKFKHPIRISQHRTYAANYRIMECYLAGDVLEENNINNEKYYQIESIYSEYTDEEE